MFFKQFHSKSKPFRTFIRYSVDCKRIELLHWDVPFGSFLIEKCPVAQLLSMIFSSGLGKSKERHLPQDDSVYLKPNTYIIIII